MGGVMWRSTPWAEVLLDVRERRGGRFASAGLRTEFSTWGGGVTVRGVAGPEPRPWKWCGVLLERRGVTVGFVCDAPRGAKAAGVGVADQADRWAPGLWRRLSGQSTVSARVVNPHDWQQGRAANARWTRWEKGALAESDRAANALFDALLHHRDWLGAAARVPEADAASLLLRWAPLGVASLEEAHAWAQVTDPVSVVWWRRSGWEDAALRAWAPALADPEMAAAYRDAGFAPKVAAGWVRRARRVDPDVAGVLAGAGWSASRAAALEVAVFRTGVDPEEVPGALQEWARVPVTPAAALVCVQAGLSPTEVATLVEAGEFDLGRVRFLAALRAGTGAP